MQKSTVEGLSWYILKIDLSFYYIVEYLLDNVYVIIIINIIKYYYYTNLTELFIYALIFEIS